VIGNLAEADRWPRRLILAHHLSVDDIERIRRRLHQLGGHVNRLRAQLHRAVVGG
jgi:hypothetical protein